MSPWNDRRRLFTPRELAVGAALVAATSLLAFFY